MRKICSWSFGLCVAGGILVGCVLAMPSFAASPDRGAAGVGKTAKPQFWFEDNNQREAGGYPPDFREMFEHPETWKELRASIDVYYMRGNTLKNLFDDLGEAFVRDRFAKVLKDANIPVAIDNIPSNTSSIRKLAEYGVTISHAALQSSISKCSPEEVPARVEQTIQEIIEFGKKLPGTKIGLVDANPTKGRPWQEPYRRLVEGVRAGGGHLDFIHLDCPCDAANSGRRISWKKIKDVEQFVHNDLGIQFGLICTSATGGKASDEQFYKDVMAIPDRYLKGPTCPDHFIIMSWYPHPSRSLPEDAPKGHYPMTKTALHFVRKLAAAFPQGNE